jgi:hypothetical protein
MTIIALTIVVSGLLFRFHSLLMLTENRNDAQ